MCYFKVRFQHLRRRIRPFLKALYIRKGCRDECLCFGMAWTVEIRSKTCLWNLGMVHTQLIVLGWPRWDSYFPVLMRSLLLLFT